MPKEESPPQREFRTFFTFGTEEGRPPEGALERFDKHTQALATAVAMAVQKTFLELDHDMSQGSDHLFLIDGLALQAATEVWAADAILRAKLAPLTMFSHARALYEAHAMTYWMFLDLPTRLPRLMKKHLIEREGFERAAEKSIGKVVTDIAPAGRTLMNDQAVHFPPNVDQQVVGHPVLEFDYAVFWKYASSHTHAGHIGTGEIDRENERTMIKQIMGGILRQAAGVYRHVVNYYKLNLGGVAEQLEEAEAYGRYRFEGAPAEPDTPRESSPVVKRERLNGQSPLQAHAELVELGRRPQFKEFHGNRTRREQCADLTPDRLRACQRPSG